MKAVLPRSFYLRDTVTVARALLGKRLVHVVKGKRLSGMIVECEAYLGVEDAAAHTFGGRRTSRNEAMYGEGGHAYVYFIYGVHYCLNAVTGKTGVPQAVLIRALEPLEGIEEMKKYRRRHKVTELTSGPGKLCQALQIGRDLNGTDLTDGVLFIEDMGRKIPSRQIIAGPRIGVAYAGEAARWPLRFHIKGNSHVS